METKTKQTLVLGGAGVAALYLLTRDSDGSGWGGGGFGGYLPGAEAGVGSDDSGGIISSVVEAVQAPFMAAPESTVDSKKSTQELLDIATAIPQTLVVDKQITPSSTTDMYNVGSGVDFMKKSIDYQGSGSMSEDVKLPGVAGAGLWDALFGASDIARFANRSTSNSMTKKTTSSSSRRTVSGTSSRTIDNLVSIVVPKRSGTSGSSYSTPGTRSQIAALKKDTAPSKAKVYSTVTGIKFK